MSKIKKKGETFTLVIFSYSQRFGPIMDYVNSPRSEKRELRQLKGNRRNRTGLSISMWFYLQHTLLLHYIFITKIF